MTPRRITLVILSLPENVCMVGVSVASIAAHAGFSELDSGRIAVCAVEAVNNAIEHAYRNAPDRTVEITVSLYEDRLCLSVTDDGLGMTTLPETALDFDPEDRESLPEGGMGLFIIRNFMDEVEYRSSPAGNVLFLTKHFSAKAV